MTKFHMSNVTLHNRWEFFRWSPEHQDRRRKQPTALPVTSVLLWLLCVVECFLSPVARENKKTKTIYSCLLAKRKKKHFLFIFCHSPGGRSWPVHPEIRASGRSPSSRSERWSGVAERRLTSGDIVMIVKQCTHKNHNQVDQCVGQ